jgi:PAS domain S-box-containing protein
MKFAWWSLLVSVATLAVGVLMAFGGSLTGLPNGVFKLWLPWFVIAFSLLAIGVAYRQIRLQSAVVAQLEQSLKGIQTTPSDADRSLQSLVNKQIKLLSEAVAERRLLIERAQDVICSIAANGEIIVASPSARSVWGYAPEELQGMHINQLIVSRDGKSGDAQFGQLLTAMSASASFENQLLRKDGATIDVLWSSYWSTSEQCFCCVAHDITERKAVDRLTRENAERIQFILDTLPASVLILTAGGTVEMANEFAVATFGKTERLPGLPYQRLLPEYELGAGETREAISSPLETLAKRFDGTTFPCEVVMRRVDFLEGRRLILIVLDNTERRMLQDIKNELISTVSHELRTPLTAVRTFIGALTMGAYGDASPEMSQRAAIADRNIARLMTLTNNLLDTERADAGQLKVRRDPASLSKIIRDAVTIVEPLYEKEGIVLGVLCAEDVQIKADSDRLVQVLVNLLGNALKYSESGTRVTVEMGRTGDETSISVVDQGRGIPEADLERVFDRFKQVNRTDGSKGFGLGLYLCKMIIEQHGGKIIASSRLGAGSRFDISLPLDSD